MQVEKRWVIKTGGGEFIAIDSNSGGYFYLTNFWDAKKFHSLEEANAYGSANWGSLKTTKWDIYSVDEIGMQYIAEAKSVDAFEVELAALKKKHGRE